MTAPLVEYFRCPESLDVLGTALPLSARAGFFRFGDAVGFGRHSAWAPAARADTAVPDVMRWVSVADGRVLLPFDLAEVLGNLRYERYAGPAPTLVRRFSGSTVAHHAYYFLRPVLPVGVRKHLQRLRLSRWRGITFPRWPVDATIEMLMREVAGLALAVAGAPALPFIWFWPEGAPGCVVMTHDVEGSAGAEFAPRLMDLDDAFAIRSSFQIVPAARHAKRLLECCRARGFEVNIHDLTHDGHLFRDRALFERRASAINRYAREFGSRGFRAAAMYRRQDWLGALDVAFDMSVPSVAHLEPQQGGCCTVMPHFLGNILEIPLTTTQDYSLFHILRDHSIDLWKEQIRLILSNHGLASFITHPDYLGAERERAVYVDLLAYLARLRDERRVWMAEAGAVDAWWRSRAAMRLVPDRGSWRIEGPGSERARLAWARLDGGRTVYELGRALRVA